MAQRTTSDKVREILASNYDEEGSPTLKPYIDRATLLVDRVATCATARGLALTAGELEGIETWLAAHFYCQMDPTYKSETTEGASGQYTGEFEKGIGSTRYGQAAMDMDISGCLKAITSGGNRIQVQWLGKPPSTAVDYVDRD